jgi:hypothetical protein
VARLIDPNITPAEAASTVANEVAAWIHEDPQALRPETAADEHDQAIVWHDSAYR